MNDSATLSAKVMKNGNYLTVFFQALICVEGDPELKTLKRPVHDFVQLDNDFFCLKVVKTKRKTLYKWNLEIFNLI